MNEQTMIAQANEMGAAAVGLPLAVRLDKNTHVRGTVIAARFARFRTTGRSRIVVWEVTLEAGSAKAHHTVHVSSLPR